MELSRREFRNIEPVKNLPDNHRGPKRSHGWAGYAGCLEATGCHFRATGGDLGSSIGSFFEKPELRKSQELPGFPFLRPPAGPGRSNLSRNNKKRIATEGEQGKLQNSIFSEALEDLDLPVGDAEAPSREQDTPPPPKKAKGPSPRLDLKREKKGRGGKTVIVISGFPNSVGSSQLKALLKKLQAACGTGGSIQGKSLEIQGDHRDLLCSLLQDEGYRPVLAGG